MSVRQNIVANYLGRAYSAAAGYLFVPFYIKFLGVEAYGVIVSYTLLLTLSSLADVGLSATFTREAARLADKEKLFDLLSTIEWILYPSIGLIALGIFLNTEFIIEYWLQASPALDRQSVLWSFRIMALMIVPQMGITLYSAGLLGLQKQVKSNVIQSLFVTIRSGLVLVPISFRPELTAFFTWQLAVTTAFALVARAALSKNLGFSLFRIGTFDYYAFKSNLKFSGGMLWLSTVASINTQLDKIIVSKTFSLTEFGYYNLASALALAPIAISTPIAVAFYPYVASCVAKHDTDEERIAFEKYGQWIALCAALGAIGIFFFAPELLAIWLHNLVSGSPVADIARALAIGTLFQCLLLAPFYLALANGQSRLIAAMATGTLLLSVPLMFIAVKFWGLLGAALPWIALNLTNLLLTLTIATRRQLGPGYLVRLTRTLVVPTGVAFGALLAARFVADTNQAPPLAACAIAGGAATIGILAFGLLQRALWRVT